MTLHVIMTCNFTSIFSINSAYWKPIVKLANGNHDCKSYNGRKCVADAKCLNGDHVTTDRCDGINVRIGCKAFFQLLISNGHHTRQYVNEK